MTEITYRPCGSRIQWTEFSTSWEQALDKAVELAKTKVAQGEWVVVKAYGVERARIMGLC